MTPNLLAFSQRLIEVWVRVYTLGLPAEHRRGRLELLRADLFEQIDEAAGEGVTPLRASLALLGRSLRGLPDDVTWRLFDAPRLAHAMPGIAFERETRMTARTPGPAFLAITAALAWGMTLLLAVATVPNSLSWAGGLLALVALGSWALEVRGAGEDETAPSASPLLLSIGIVAIAGGVVFSSSALGLALAVPVALGLTVAVAREVVEARQIRAARDAILPVSDAELVRHAARGDAIAIEAASQRGITRRAVLRSSFGLGIASGLAMMGGVVIDFLWQRNVAGFGGVVTAGTVSDFPPGSKTIVRQGKFWLVNLTEAQGGPGFLALWQKCPHLGCVVPWEERFRHVDPETGRDREGWFRCPCHQSTYNDAGVRVFGPAPRSMDRMALTITEGGFIEVDTGDISNGTDDNAAFAIRDDGV